MDLYIFDSDLNLLGILDNFSSLQWARRYAKCGDFELHCSLDSYTLDMLKRGNILWKNDDEEAAYIEYRQMDQDNEGKETLTVKGKFLSGYLSRRIIWGEELLQSAAEVAMRTLITKHVISPVDTNRVIPNLILGALKGYTQMVNYQVSYKNLLEEIENLCSLSELGYRVAFDAANKKLVFDTYAGIDRSVSQSVNPRAIFSKEFDNILEQSYSDSLNNYRNLALVGGMGEGVARKLVTVGSASGLDRFEDFVDAKDLTNVVDGVTLTDAEYEATLTGRGNSKLAETAEVKTFDSTINLNSNLVYKTDFDLGDIVTCISKRWGLTIDARITEIQEVYEESGKSINITFGNQVPTLLDKIKQAVRK